MKSTANGASEAAGISITSAVRSSTASGTSSTSWEGHTCRSTCGHITPTVMVPLDSSTTSMRAGSISLLCEPMRSKQVPYAGCSTRNESALRQQSAVKGSVQWDASKKSLITCMANSGRTSREMRPTLKWRSKLGEGFAGAGTAASAAGTVDSHISLALRSTARARLHCSRCTCVSSMSSSPMSTRRMPGEDDASSGMLPLALSRAGCKSMHGFS